MTQTAHLTGHALIARLSTLGVDAVLHEPGVPMPTVPLAAEAIGVQPDDIVKSLCFTTADGTLVLAIPCGTARVDRAALAQAAGTGKLVMADPETVLRGTGYPAGGVAPVLHAESLIVIVDRRVTERPIVYGGGGSEDTLLRIPPSDILRLTNATVADIVQGERS